MQKNEIQKQHYYRLADPQKAVIINVLLFPFFNSVVKQQQDKVTRLAQGDCLTVSLFQHRAH